MKRSALMLFLLIPLSFNVSAAKAGQSARITTGLVEKADKVNLDSEAGKGALVGGSLGLLSARNKSSGKKVRNSIVGGTAGAVLANSAQGSRNGMAYTVKSTSGAQQVRIVTDQTELRVGDCVTVEESGNTANIRRVSSNMCQPEYTQAVNAISHELQEEASECARAKQEMIEAASKEQLELAKMKMDLLCND